jgi:iron complex transport system substrate-binding protein
MRTLVIAFVMPILLLTPVLGLSSTIVDSSGQQVVMDKPFSRIISLYSAHTENLSSLGVENSIIGISSSDDFPPSILNKPKFSYREDPEKFIAARPDLVLVRPMIERSYPQLIAKLRQTGITVVSLQPTSVDGIFEYWRSLGILTGREQQAEAMIASFTSELQEIASLVASISPQQRKMVYFEAIHAKMKTFAPESIAIFALEQAGGQNVAADAPRVRKTNIAFYGKERILAKSGEIDVFLAQQGRMNPVTIDIIKNEPGFQALEAVRDNKIFLVDERLVSRPTIRILEGIEQIGGILYPEFFSSAAVK